MHKGFIHIFFFPIKCLDDSNHYFPHIISFQAAIIWSMGLYEVGLLNCVVSLKAFYYFSIAAELLFQ
ncbi:hypothetical protein CEXT_322391 [Caerostris extrusa]|uniref:Uncharacterized protein n=1 Tax=Caerostris extrusa TaxID=172846 RepID=A0AAV4MSF0_CAEEX|nr:hypothetical protein CEXT_322391 [Caerostris extrusa]